MREIFAENKNFSTPRCREINKSQAIFFLICKSHAFSSRQLNYREFPLIILNLSFLELLLAEPQHILYREEPMTEVTGFRQSVRLFWSRDPVAPSILSSFLLHLSDALPSGRVLLRLSVRHPYADSPTAVQALKVDSHHGSHASQRYRCFVIWLFPFPECLSICDRFYTLLG